MSIMSFKAEKYNFRDFGICENLFTVIRIDIITTRGNLLQAIANQSPQKNDSFKNFIHGNWKTKNMCIFFV